MNQVKSPILFLIFNRPDTTQKVFDQIRQARPTKLYVAADGPRNKKSDKELCKQTRDIIQVDWDCELVTLYRESNLGCKNAVSSAIKWFFGQEPEGIVLEDDCLPSDDFFGYCDTLLARYRNDQRVNHISGTCMHFGAKFGPASYYFSRYTNIWGWASWQRVWKDYDENVALAADFIQEDLVKNIYPVPQMQQSILNALNAVSENRIDTWDYQYAFLNLWSNGLCINPNNNMIKNIGFGKGGTHTQDSNNRYANMEYQPLGELTHPKFFVPNLDADLAIHKQENPDLLKRAIRKIKRKLKQS